MGYLASKPPSLMRAAPLTAPGRKWVYFTTDTAADVDTVGYIERAQQLGLLLGDLLEVHSADGVSYHAVSALHTNGSATLRNLVAPPVSSVAYILTEAADRITTESGDRLIME